MSLAAARRVLRARARRSTASGFPTLCALALLTALAGLAPSGAEAAFACRTENGKRTCGVVPTQPRTSAVPNPGVSPTLPPATGPTGAVTRPRPACGPRSISGKPC